MKNYIIIFLIIFFTTVSCKTSYTKIGNKNANYIPYYLKVYEIDSLFYTKNYKDYKIELENLFDKYEPLNIVFYNEYEKYVKAIILTDNKTKINKEIRMLIKNFGYKQKKMLQDSILNIALKKSNFSSNYITSLEQKYLNSLDLSFRKQLIQMEYDDQEIRKREGLTYEERKPLMRIVDKKNDSIFKNYLINNGFPGDKKVGINQLFENEEGFSTNLLLNHFSYNGSYEFYKDKLPSYIKNGTCDPKNYAMLLDRWYLVNKNHCYYCFGWSQKIKEIENNEVKVNQINLERKKIGLPSIQQEKVLFKRLNETR